VDPKQVAVINKNFGFMLNFSRANLEQ